MILSSRNQQTEENVKSPLNYTGGKFRILPQIKKFFPKNVDIFYDIFCGGANVGVNAEARNVICVDKNRKLIELLEYMRINTSEYVIDTIEENIRRHGLSDSWRNGYGYYGCASSGGLARFNREPFLKLKAVYNRTHEPILLLMLIFFSFNNQLRFNARGEFNLPVGKRDFNGRLRKSLERFMTRMQKKNIRFKNADFRELEKEKLAAANAFLYLDPPYSLGVATYNENGGWDEKDDRSLLEFLSGCHQKGIKFALSNVAVHKKRTNEMMLKWCAELGLNINYLSRDYKNSSYHKKDKSGDTREILITSY